VYIDPDSRAELTVPTGSNVVEQYDIRKIEGTWKVVGIIRAT